MNGERDDARNDTPVSRRLRARAKRVARRLLEAYILFPAFALVLLAAGWLTVLHLIAVERAQAIRTAIDTAHGVADTYEAQVVHSLQAIDQTLKTIAFAYVVHRDTTLASLGARDMLPSPVVFRIAMTDAQGRVTASTERMEQENVAARRCFEAQRDSKMDMLYIGRAMSRHGPGAAQVVFSRRLVDADGRFAGIVMLTVDPAYFTSGYDAVRMGRRGLIALLGTDGFLRVVRQGDHIASGTAISDIGRYAHAGETLGIAPWDGGVLRFTNVRTLHGFPLFAIVGLSHDEQLERYDLDRTAYLREAFFGSIVVLALTMLLSVKSWQLSQSRVRARELRQAYVAASEASLDAFFVWRRVDAATLPMRRGPAGAQASRFLLTDVNGRGVELMGRPRKALIGSLAVDVLTRADDQNVLDEFLSVYDSGVFEEHEWLHVRDDGALIWLHRRVVRVDDGLVAIVRDISMRKLAEARRAAQNRVLEMIATNMPLEDVLESLILLLESQVQGCIGAIVLKSDDGQHVRVGAAPSLSAAFSKLTHGERIGPDASPGARAIHTRLRVLVDKSDDIPVLCELVSLPGDAFTRCEALPILAPNCDALGSLTLFMRGADALASGDWHAVSDALRLAGIAIEKTRAEERIRHMANHDALTGLPNRTLLADRLGQMLLQARSHRRSVSVVFVDLDNFKLINDSLGHRAGDDLLKEIATRMVGCVQPTDTVVRLGGDEFVFVLDSSRRDMAAMKALIERVRARIVEPIVLAGKPYQVTCSMGIAIYPEDGIDADALLMNADAAMYRAKELGRNTYQFYTPQINLRAHARLSRQAQLRNALARNEFRVVYQPQVDARTGRMFGVEALIRWDHPIDGTIPPDEFIPPAEETGLIVPIGEWVLREACRQNKRWQDDGLPSVTMSVNVSARQFRHEGWIDTVARALSDSGLAPGYLELELTESVIMEDLDRSIDTMRRLRAMGVRLTIDDFGTGYSSLSALKNFPVVRLKIDRAFVRDLPEDEDDRAIATAVISLGRKLNMNVIAEGVETKAQVEFLLKHDCHEIQGYHFSKPLRPEEIAARLVLGFDAPLSVDSVDPVDSISPERLPDSADSGDDISTERFGLGL